ncbi:MAG: methyltransferase domain-containing protein [Pseudanabaena sp. ELA607]
MSQAEYLKILYSNRFDLKQRKAKNALWKVLIQCFLQKHINRNGRILDIAGGYCEFINQIQAKEKFLLDLNPDVRNFAAPNVNVVQIDILDKISPETLPCNYFDTIFVSNFFEHLRSKEELIQVLVFCFERLKPSGNLLIIQPNFKHSCREYYDFIDHHLPITDSSLEEVLRAVGYSIEIVIPRFLPFSTKGRPSSTWLLKIYLRIPFLWNFLGGQMFVKASRP